MDQDTSELEDRTNEWKHHLECLNLWKKCGEKRKWVVLFTGLELSNNDEDEEPRGQEHLMISLLRKAYKEVLNADGLTYAGLINTEKNFMEMMFSHFIFCPNEINKKLKSMLMAYYEKPKLAAWLQSMYIAMVQTELKLKTLEELESKKRKKKRCRHCSCKEFREAVTPTIVFNVV